MSVSAAPTPELSIVIATYHRAETLRRTLGYLAAQDIEPARFEVIVVDDASPDDTPRVVGEVAPRLPYELRFLRNDVNSGPGYTQNRGIREARGRLLLITTDDVFLEPWAIRAHLEFHRAHPESEFVALGRVLQSPELRDTALMRNWDPFRFWLLDDGQELLCYMFWACNVSCKLEFMLRHGMFREHRGRGGAVAFEDLEVGYRLSHAGMRLLHVAAAVGYHYHEYTIDGAIERWHMRGLNYGELRSFVPDPLLDVYFHVLNLDTWRRYVRALRTSDSLQGLEANAAWHLFREGVRALVLNRWTARWIWRPLLDAAEKSPAVERLATRQIYRAFFYYHFRRGVRDAQRLYGPASPSVGGARMRRSKKAAT